MTKFIYAYIIKDDGAVAEAAVMTGFERNSDVVRLAATAPLFNKVVTDGTYRWTTDAIWFDNEAMWRTPNYYVQQMFAKYLGKKVLETRFETYRNGDKVFYAPCGGAAVVAAGDVEFKNWKVTANKGKKVLLEQDFAKELAEDIVVQEKEDGRLFGLDRPMWWNYTVEFTAVKKTDAASLHVIVGAQNVNAPGHADYIGYCVGTNRGTGLKVCKSGVKGYTLGDYSSSVFAGNLRACYDEPVPAGEYTVTVNYGGRDGKSLICYYSAKGSKEKKGLLECRLEPYIREIFHSVTVDETKVYAKLVNPESFEKKVLVKLENLHVANKAEVITLTGGEELVHKPNVNTKEKEWVVPASNKLTVKNNVLEVVLPANSVTVVVFDRV